MKCPVCGSAELVHDTRDIPHIYKGETTVIPAVTGDFCPSCGEVILDKEHGDRLSQLMGIFQRQVNASIVDPSFIANVRKKLLLDQREAAELFGGGTVEIIFKQNRQKKRHFSVFPPSHRCNDLLTEESADLQTAELQPPGEQFHDLAKRRETDFFEASCRHPKSL